MEKIDEKILALAAEAKEKFVGGKAANMDEFNPERYELPPFCERVTYGTANCELILFFGKSKVALIDAGMAYCAPRIIENIEKALAKRGRKTLDYVILSHSHYDHVGALPFFIKRWPKLKIFASEKCKKVFESENARKVFKRLGENARDSYGAGLWNNTEIPTEPFRVDVVVKEGDRIEIGEQKGEEYFKVLETKGHTDCSLAFGYEPAHILFASESTGVYLNHEYIHSAILKSFAESMKSAEKCSAYGADRIISPHYGFVPRALTEQYFEIFRECAENEKELILYLRERLDSYEDLMKAYTAVFWNSDRNKEQPIGAFLANAVPIVNTVLKEFGREYID